MKTTIALIAVTALAALAARAETITIRGSDTMVILAQRWAEVYMGQNPHIRIQITGGGTGTGFAALQNRTADLINASREIRPRELEASIRAFHRRPTQYKVAIDGVAIYVNEANPVTELSIEQLAQIYTGRVRNWRELGGQDAPIIVYGRENTSGTYEFFKERVLQGRDFAADVQTMPGTASVLQAVSKDRNGIGYGGSAFAGGVRFLSVRADAASPAVAPTEENVVSKKYPIWRYLYIFLNPALDKGAVADYINWIRSDAGQQVVREMGYFPLPAHLRHR